MEYSNKRDIHNLYLDHTNAYEEVKKQILKVTSDDKSYDPNSLLEIYLWLYLMEIKTNSRISGESTIGEI